MATHDLTNDRNTNYAQDVKLCIAVRAHPCIYDRSHPSEEEYDKAWQTIANMCDDTVPFCKLRWRTISKGFTHFKQLTGSKKRQSSRVRGYYLQNELDFLIPFIDGKKSADTEDDFETNKDSKEKDKKNKSKSVSPEKRCLIPGKERTTTADAAVEASEKPPTIVQDNKVNIFIVPKRDEDEKTEPKEAVKSNENAVGGVETVAIRANYIELTAKTEKPVENVVDARPNRFRRACKRSLDKTVVQELRNNSPESDAELKRFRRGLSARRATLKPEWRAEPKSEDKIMPKITPPQKKKKYQEKLNKPALQQSPTSSSSMDQKPTINPSDFVETQLQRSSLSEPRVLLNSSVENSSQFSPFPVMMVEPSKCDQAVQCNKMVESLTSDDKFLNTLRPQMEAMNARQKLNFMQKVYKSVIEVFDNAADFPGADELGATLATPLPVINAPTSAEMCLIRELVSMVQAAKSSSEILKPLEASNEKKANLVETTDSASQTLDSPTTIINEKGQQILTLRYAVPANPEIPDGDHRQFVRKVVKVSGAIASHEGDKRRVYRVLPKGVLPQAYNGSSSGVGTFIIPRTPGSIASSVNAAVAAGSSISSSTLASRNNIYHQIPGGKSYVSSSGSHLISGSVSPGLRAVAIRNTVRPSGTCVPRQMVRRYSVAGSAIASQFDKPKTTNIVTTTVNTPPSVSKPTITIAMRPETQRIVRANTTTPPFKQPAAPTTAAKTTLHAANTMIAMSGNNMRQMISHSLTRNKPDPPAKKSATSPPSATVTAKMDRFFDALLTSTSSSSSSFTSPGTSTTSTSNSSSPSEDPLEINKTEGPTKNFDLKPKASERNDYTISSDNFNGIDIKNEPIDH